MNRAVTITVSILIAGSMLSMLAFAGTSQKGRGLITTNFDDYADCVVDTARGNRAGIHLFPLQRRRHGIADSA